MVCLKSRTNQIVLVIFGCSVIIGIFAYRQYVVSKNFLQADKAYFQSIGKTINSEGCVDEIVHWYSNCKAMKSLCDVSTPKMMDFCLLGQPRKDDCNRYGPNTSDTHFGYPQCQARNVTRKTKKPCALAYRVIDKHCQTLKKSESL
jgi:hypothetical protein